MSADERAEKERPLGSLWRFSGGFDEKRGDWVQRVHSRYIEKHAGDVKTARCIKTVIDEEK